MARGRRSRRAGRRSNIKTRLVGRVNRIPPNPPSLDIQANVFTCWLRSETGVSETNNKYWVNEWSILELLTNSYKHLMDVFAEYRLKRVNIWFIPSIPITDTGIYAMAVYDDGDNYFVTPSLSDICSAPGSQSGKRYQTLRSAWHRTEPKDKNWVLMNAESHPLSTAIATSQLPITGVLICDIHIAFRGLKAASSRLRPRRFDVGKSASEYLEALQMRE